MSRTFRIVAGSCRLAAVGNDQGSLGHWEHRERQGGNASVAYRVSRSAKCL